ncbi:MAG: hypothetical protein V4671_31870, partial [Armatimonadota bacterium]
MEKDDAYNLASFINERGSRFSAGVLSFGDRGWVVVKDTETERPLEPIADPEDYLYRASTGALQIDDTCRPVGKSSANGAKTKRNEQRLI